MAAPSSVRQLLNNAPFTLLPQNLLTCLEERSELIRYELGARILSPDQFPPGLLVVLQGDVRLMACLSSKRVITLERRGPGQLLGWVSLLRGQPCELVQVSEPCVCLLIPVDLLLDCWRSSEEFLKFFVSRSTPSELAASLLNQYNSFLAPPVDEEQWLKQGIEKCRVISPEHSISNEHERIILSSFVAADGPQPGDCVASEYCAVSANKLPLRRILCPSYLIDPYLRKSNKSNTVQDPDGGSVIATPKTISLDDVSKPAKDVLSTIATAEELGLIPAEQLRFDQRFSCRRGDGPFNEAKAVIQTLAESLNVPFPSEVVERVLRQQLKRRSETSLELLAALSELLGLQTRMGAVRFDQVNAVEFPAIVCTQEGPSLLHACEAGHLIVADPRQGLSRLLAKDFFESDQKNIRVLLASRNETTKTDRFDWRWFLPLIIKYRTSLLVVVSATFAIQMATLGIPLLMQQIIDKTLSQGNISSLNVLGSTLVALALFQSILSGLKTFVFTDTANRMDLQLGANVMDRLLRLPLPYFDKRPVGELSQRLGEMAQIRSFLTGTAITSFMDLIFSAIYLVTMLLYSPLLTAVALSTMPFYIILIIIVAPVFKSLIRRQAVANAKTQSHVIEVLSSIQTVKAQNVEMISRWKWQDRYQDFVEQGFKALTVGVVSGQVGGLLNTLSGLLILWVGMIQVIEGNLTLGQLIAFRIIAGYVTGPLLRLSNLYQGFQKVSLSFERLGDIINQQPESSDTSLGQIALPPIQGEVRYDSLNFRFGKQGPLNLDSVDLSVEPGEFVGVAGLSGSGKSTLMKLLARLYPADSGRILIDGYDISKVDLNSLRQQVGIVPQESLLFEGSVRDNITLGRPEASTEDVITAAKIACAHDFIMELSDGYNTHLAEKGSNLSGGQRQRLAIARTLLQEPRLLVMDEATSALDYQTEALVCQNLRDHLRGRTVFFITHRLSTIRNADRIVLMHQGRVVEQGSHNELMDLKSRYFALYRQQEASSGENS